MEPTIVASIIGIIATTQIHISKGLQKYGIDALRPADHRTHPIEHQKRKKLLYFAGIILNNAAFLWVLIANLYAPTSYYTSMFGFGLVVLMLFSEHILHEKHTALQHAGAVIIAAGTILVGISRSSGEIPAMSMVDFQTVLIFIAIYFPINLVLLAVALKLQWKKPLGILFGTVTGCAAAMDPIFKGIGQSFGTQIKLIPHTPVGWFIFLASFLFGAIAFSFTQIGFYKHAKASTLVAFHNITLILMPLLLLKLSLPGFTLTRLQLSGVFVVIIGIGLMFSEATFSLLFKGGNNLNE